MEALARNWWALVLRGIAGVIFGVLTFMFPAMTLNVLILLFGAYAIVDGVFNIVAAAPTSVATRVQSVVQSGKWPGAMPNQTSPSAQSSVARTGQALGTPTRRLVGWSGGSSTAGLSSGYSSSMIANVVTVVSPCVALQAVLR